MGSWLQDFLKGEDGAPGANGGSPGLPSRALQRRNPDGTFGGLANAAGSDDGNLVLGVAQGNVATEGSLRIGAGLVDGDGFISYFRDGDNTKNLGLFWAYSYAGTQFGSPYTWNSIGFGGWAGDDSDTPDDFSVITRRGIIVGTTAGGVKDAGFWGTFGGVSANTDALHVGRSFNLLMQGKDAVPSGDVANLLGGGSGIFHLGWAQTKSTTGVSTGLPIYADVADGLLKYRKPDNTEVVLDGAGGGGVAALENIGGGAEVFSGMSGTTAQFRCISGDGGIEVEAVGDTILIHGAGAGAPGASAYGRGVHNVTGLASLDLTADTSAILKFEGIPSTTCVVTLSCGSESASAIKRVRIDQFSTADFVFTTGTGTTATLSGGGGSNVDRWLQITPDGVEAFS